MSAISCSLQCCALGLYDTISDSISARDIILGLYDTISDAQPEGQGHSISICDILLGLYDTISDSISVRDILLEFIWYYIGFNKCQRYPVHRRWIGIIWYISDSISVRDILLESSDTISDSISIRDILLEFIWYYIGFNKYPRYPIGI